MSKTKENHSKRLLSVKECADLLGISERTIYNGLSKKAKNPFPVKPIRKWGVKFDINDINAFIEASKTPSTQSLPSVEKTP